MGTYIILSKVSAQAFSKPEEFKKIAAEVSAKIKKECPDVTWKDSYATTGRFDSVDIVESDNPEQVTRAAMIIRAYGHATTESLCATPWDDFIDMI